MLKLFIFMCCRTCLRTGRVCASPARLGADAERKETRNLTLSFEKLSRYFSHNGFANRGVAGPMKLDLLFFGVLNTGSNYSYLLNFTGQLCNLRVKL